MGKVDVSSKVTEGHCYVYGSFVKIPLVLFQCLSCVVVVAEKNAFVSGDQCSHGGEGVVRVVRGGDDVMEVGGTDCDDEEVVSQCAWHGVV